MWLCYDRQMWGKIWCLAGTGWLTPQQVLCRHNVGQMWYGIVFSMAWHNWYHCSLICVPQIYLCCSWPHCDLLYMVLAHVLTISSKPHVSHQRAAIVCVFWGWVLYVGQNGARQILLRGMSLYTFFITIRWDTMRADDKFLSIELKIWCDINWESFAPFTLGSKLTELNKI